MSWLEELQFPVLEVSGQNYYSWCYDVELHLQVHGLSNAIVKDNKASNVDKANALILIRYHLHETLKTQYGIIREPDKLWEMLKERYDNKTALLIEAQHDWQNLHLQYFKSVSDYNSALFTIISKFELCGVKLSNDQLLEKAFSTFDFASPIMRQQCRQHHFNTYFELNPILLVAEKNNLLLLKNHGLKHVG